MIGADVKLDKKGNASEALIQADRAYRRDAASKAFAFSQEVVPQDRGTLLQSGFQPEFRGDSIVWGYTGPQAAPMEYGTDPYYPPVEPLLEWSRRVTGDEGLGWYVARKKIPKEGIDAQPYLRPSAEIAEQWLQSHDFSDYYEDTFK